MVLAAGCSTPASDQGAERQSSPRRNVSIPIRDLFPVGRGSLSRAGEGIIDRVSGWLQKSNGRIVVGCDTTPPIRFWRFRSSIRLPLERAFVVAERLRANGIAAERIVVTRGPVESPANPDSMKITVLAR